MLAMRRPRVIPVSQLYRDVTRFYIYEIKYAISKFRVDARKKFPVTTTTYGQAPMHLPSRSSRISPISLTALINYAFSLI